MSELTRAQTEQIAIIMQYLYEHGFDLETVKRAADAWWQIKAAAIRSGQAKD